MNIRTKQINPKYLVLALVVFVVLTVLNKTIGVGGIIVLLVLGVILFRNGMLNSFISNFFSNTTMANPFSNNTKPSSSHSLIWKTVKIVLGIALGLWVISWGIVIIGAGETGVYSLFGKVHDTEMRSGIHLIIPLARVDRMSIRTEQYTMSIAPSEGQVRGDDSITSLTKEGLEVNIDFTSLYRLDEPKASDMYREVGLDYVNKLIRPEIRGVIRDIVSQYEAKELYSEKRQEASTRMATLLREKLGSRGIVIEEAVIRNVQLPASLAQAIQAKLASEQEAQRYDFVLAKEQKEAERKRIEAQGQRDAQTIINESLTSEYLNYLYIKELKDRQGTIYVPTDSSSGMPLFKGI
ncbi:MAG: prohibitin family protein [Candidatus Pacebacteria bacterium]|nr:prohibitin family protein [Candidatus Paceibacterota bacterium]